ncbi:MULTISPECIES: MFS transporter [unclassified Streptomyces]|uniref:MFS transporter n=1 Tax=unclassified Streptomyces TaxID=2593676 RepID=UPI0033219303
MSLTETTTRGTPPAGAPSGRPRTVLFLVCVAIFMLMLDATVVTAALAGIRAHFNASIDALQWVVDAYSIPLAGFMLTFATLGDRFGRKRMFLTGMAVFTVASLALTLVGTIVELDVLRAVQGVGAAMLFATALPLLSVAFPEPAPRAKAIGVYGAVMAGATVLGPVIGGVLVTEFGWRSIFTVNLPIGAAVLVLAALWMPEPPRTRGRRADGLGSLLLTGGLVAGVFAVTRSSALGWTSSSVIALLVTAAALLSGFLAWQVRGAKHPLLDIAMARKPGFAGTAIVSVGHMATLMAATTYLSLFLIGTLGYTPLQMGLRVIPISIGAMIAAPLTAILAKRLPISVSLTATMALVAAGMFLLGGFTGHDSWTYFLPGEIVGGVGLGAITAANQAASLTFASQENAGMASATFGTLRQVGMAVGIAGLGSVFSHVAREKAASGLATLPEAGSLPQDLKQEFVHQLGAASGRQAVAMVPPQFRDSVPALTRVADHASIDALNSVATLAAVVAVVTVLLAVIAFAVDRGRAVRRMPGRRAAGRRLTGA